MNGWSRRRSWPFEGVVLGPPGRCCSHGRRDPRSAGQTWAAPVRSSPCTIGACTGTRRPRRRLRAARRHDLGYLGGPRPATPATTRSPRHGPRGASCRTSTTSSSLRAGSAPPARRLLRACRIQRGCRGGARACTRDGDRRHDLLRRLPAGRHPGGSIAGALAATAAFGSANNAYVLPHSFSAPVWRSPSRSAAFCACCASSTGAVAARRGGRLARRPRRAEPARDCRRAGSGCRRLERAARRPGPRPGGETPGATCARCRSGPCASGRRLRRVRRRRRPSRAPVREPVSGRHARCRRQRRAARARAAHRRELRRAGGAPRALRGRLRRPAVGRARDLRRRTVAAARVRHRGRPRSRWWPGARPPRDAPLTTCSSRTR